MNLGGYHLLCYNVYGIIFQGRQESMIGTLLLNRYELLEKIGEEEHINFIVMEYIHGKTLKQVIKAECKFL